MPGPGRVDGNELRWPGYIGPDYREGHGVLCVGAVHRESPPKLERSNPVIARTNAELAAGAREWLASGRSEAADERYLRQLQATYKTALPAWSRWNRHFRTLIEDYLEMDRSEIAWVNVAKCRVSINRGARQRAAEAELTRLCQRQFPMSELVEAIRPVAVLIAGLHAGREGGIVSSWDSASASPMVFAWQAQSGHDRHNTAPGRRKLSEWAPSMAAEVRSAFAD